MSSINTKRKGDIFENKIYGIISDLIYKDEFYVNSKKSRIFSKKGYFSESRQDDIIVDVSIETYLDNSDDYSILTIIECKNYENKGVPVDDIEEFDSKLNQIGAHCTKGILVTNSYFQKSTISIAKSKKIGLLRINDNNEIDWVNRRIDRKIDFSNDLIINDLCSTNTNNNFIALLQNKRINNLSDLLIELGIIDKFNNKPKYINLPYRTELEISNVIEQNRLNDFYINGQLDLIKLCDYLKDTYDVSFDFDEDLGHINSQKILGKLTFKPLNISISKDIKTDIHRWRFTLAHEIGHLIIHSNILINYLDTNYDDDLTLKIDTDRIFSFYNKRMEIQANLFASRLLIPQDRFIKHVKDYFIRERIYKGFLYLDSQKCNYELTNRLLLELQSLFNVSKEAAKIRLISQNLLIDETDLSLQRMFRK